MTELNKKSTPLADRDLEDARSQSVKKSRTLRQSQRRGAIAVLMALILVIVIAFLAFSIDLGHITNTESELQNAADAGALSGARALSNGRDAGIAAAQIWAAKNVAAIQPVNLVVDQDIEIGTWDEKIASFTVVPVKSTIVPNAVRVICRRNSERGNPLPLFFAPMIGTKNANLTVSAIAQNKGSSCGGIMALEKIYLNDRQVGRASYTDSYDSNNGDYYSQTPGKNGDICTNGHLTLNGNSKVSGDARWWEQAKTPNATQSQVSGEFAKFGPEPIDFPEIDPGDAATNNYNFKLSTSTNGNPVLVGKRFQLGSIKTGTTSTPSTGLSTGTPDSVTLPPGTYYFSEMAVGSLSTINVTGPTYIYVEGQIDLKWGNINNTTKKPINLQIYPMGANTFFYLPFFGSMYASIYSTKAHIYLDEKTQPVNFNFFGKMVGQKIRVWDTGLHVDESISFGALKSGGEQKGKSGVTLVQ